METTTFLLVIAIGLLITFNSDLKIFYDKASKYLFGNQRNICKY